MADRNLEHPLGMLENVLVESCRVKYVHSFAIVDFGQDPSYEVILGRPFMRQLQVIQDWGLDYLYLRPDNLTTRVNLVDYTYRDVITTPMDDFDSFSSGLTPNSADSSNYLENAWIFQSPTDKILAEDRHLIDKVLMEKDYVTSPFLEHLMDDHEWIHVLAALDTCTISNGPQFCDDDDDEIIPIKMVNLMHYVPECEDFHYIKEAILITDVSLSEDNYLFYDKDESGYAREEWFEMKDDYFVPKCDLEKVRILLRERKAIVLDTTIQALTRKHQKQRKKCREKQAQSKGRKRQPVLSNKTNYLLHVKAKDCIKTHKRWKATLHSIQGTDSQTSVKTTKSRREKCKTAQALAQSISSNKETKSQKATKEEPIKMSKIERKVAFKECKCMLSESLQSWSDSSGSASTNEGDAISVP